MQWGWCGQRPQRLPTKPDLSSKPQQLEQPLSAQLREPEQRREAAQQPWPPEGLGPLRQLLWRWLRFPLG